ncbi:MAG: hypothetical protein ABF868_09065 [Sporolactobacillus sp.]
MNSGKRNLTRLGIKAISYLFTLVAVIILLLNLFYSRGYESVGLRASFVFKGVTLLVAGAGVAMLIWRNRQIVRHLSRVPPRWAVTALLIVSLLLQSGVLIFLNVRPSWDFRYLVDGANYVLHNGTISSYFFRYPNNIFPMLLLAALGWLGTPQLLFYQIVNIVAIAASQYMVYQFVRRRCGQGVALACLFAAVFAFPLIGYAPIVYTDTLPLPFAMAALCLMTNSSGELKTHGCNVWLVSLTVAVCFMLKGTLIVLPIAYALVLLLFAGGWRKFFSLLPLITCLVFHFIFFTMIYDFGLVDHAQISKNAFPIAHWILMGENEWTYGKYEQRDVDTTHRLMISEPKAAVTQQLLNETRERIMKRGFLGNLHFWMEKLAMTWTDGTFYVVNVLRRLPEHPPLFRAFLFNGLTAFFVQAMARMALIVLAVGFFSAACRSRKCLLSASDCFMMLTCIGLFFFLCIWETRSRYLVSAIPYFIILAASGYFPSRHLPLISHNTQK